MTRPQLYALIRDGRLSCLPLVETLRLIRDFEAQGLGYRQILTELLRLVPAYRV